MDTYLVARQERQAEQARAAGGVTGAQSGAHPAKPLEQAINRLNLKVLAIFGPTAVGKTGVAIAVAELLRQRGEDPVAVSCDALQVYRGLEVLTGAPTEAEQAGLEHRLVGIIGVDEEFSAGRFSDLARGEIDSLLAADRRPIVVGGTGLYMRAALSDMELRPPVRIELREQVEREIAERGPEALHAELEPELAGDVHANDRKRIARLTELQRAGFEPPPPDGGELWTAQLRHPTLLVGLVVDRDDLARRIDTRVDELLARGAADEARAAEAAGPSRTARAALGFEQLLSSDVEGMKRAHRAYARRQLTWMRKMPGVTFVDRTGRRDSDVAQEVTASLGRE
jgi:tRNA dimethylallyltransferase